MKQQKEKQTMNKGKLKALSTACDFLLKAGMLFSSIIFLIYYGTSQKNLTFIWMALFMLVALISKGVIDVINKENTTYR